MNKFALSLALFTSTTAMALPGHFTLDMEHKDDALAALSKQPTFQKQLTEVIGTNQRRPADEALKTTSLRAVYRSALTRAQPESVVFDIDTWLRDDDTSAWDQTIRTQLQTAHPREYASVLQAVKEGKALTETNMALYGTFLQRFGATKILPVEALVLTALSPATSSSTVRGAIYTALTGSQFMTVAEDAPFDVKSSSFTPSLTRAVTSFALDNKVTELELGSEQVLRGLTQDQLGLSENDLRKREGYRAFYTFSAAEMKKTGVLRVNEHATANPDIVSGLHASELYTGLLDGVGMNSLQRIADRSMERVWENDETMASIHSLLKPGGIFEVWNMGDQDKRKNAPIFAQGFQYVGYTTDANGLNILSYKKINPKTIPPSGFNPQTYAQLNPELMTRFKREQRQIAAKQSRTLSDTDFRGPALVKKFNGWLHALVRISVDTGSEKPLSWIQGLPTAFDWSTYLDLNRSYLEGRYKREHHLNDTQLASYHWQKGFVFWIQALAKASITRNEVGLSWVKGVPANFNWKTHLSENPSLESQFKTEHSIAESAKLTPIQTGQLATWVQAKAAEEEALEKSE